MNLENRIEVGSVSEFLEAVKQIYCDQDHQLFYRGVSKKVYFKSPSLEYKPKPQYIAQQYTRLIIGNETIKKSFYSLEKAKSFFSELSNDHPGIYRNKNWIENEDKMFYELTAKCPEYFKDCKTTFEHLVMMQHYGYPTRLLDITSNPLVALYFACGGSNGSNSEDGQLISYHIKKNDIRNYESDRVSLLSNLCNSNTGLHIYLYIYQELEREYAKCLEDLIIVEQKTKMEIAYLFDQNLIRKNQIEYLSRALKNCPTLDDENYESLLGSLNTYIFGLLQTLESSLWIKSSDQLSDDDYETFHYIDMGLEEVKEAIIKIISYIREQFEKHEYIDMYNKCCQKMKVDKPYFNEKLIKSKDIRTIQCVLPKQNNPRLIAQQGAFLLFGFKDAVSDKTATPIVDPKMYGELCMKDGKNEILKDQNSSQKAKIIIKGSEKQKILDELKILGISNSTMFPEIDNIANELKSQYAKLR